MRDMTIRDSIAIASFSFGLCALVMWLFGLFMHDAAIMKGSLIAFIVLMVIALVTGWKMVVQAVKDDLWR